MNRKIITMLAIIVVIALFASSYSTVYASNLLDDTSQEFQTGTSFFINLDDIKTKDEYYCKKRIYNSNQIEQYKDKHLKQKESIEKAINSNSEVVSIVEYEYMVSETFDKSGNTIDSHVMTNQEVLLDSLKQPILSTNKRTLTAQGLLDQDFQKKANLKLA